VWFTALETGLYRKYGLDAELIVHSKLDDERLHRKKAVSSTSLPVGRRNRAKVKTPDICRKPAYDATPFKTPGIRGHWRFS
jgi:hypothetical protein